MQGSSGTLHTRQSSIQKNKYKVSHKHSCILMEYITLRFFFSWRYNPHWGLYFSAL